MMQTLGDMVAAVPVFVMAVALGCLGLMATPWCIHGALEIIGWLKP